MIDSFFNFGVPISDEFYMREEPLSFEEARRKELMIAQSLSKSLGLGINFGIVPEQVNDNSKNIKKKRNRNPTTSSTSENVKRTKNIVKNYGNAIAAFAISNIALPYLEPMIEQEDLKLNTFQQFVAERKDQITSIDAFRALLQESKDDSDIEIKCKRIFKQIGIVFVKYFAVNWIFSSKIKYRDDHLKYRGRMLRRIMNPHLFTYLKKKRK
jgi:hypothetical protein